MGRCVVRVLTLFTLAALARSARGCPRPCACPQPGEVHCTFRSLLTVPAGVSRQVERMNLGFNTINRITDRSFAGMRKLELLMMHGNNIHNIPDGAFHDLISLQMMKMSYNKLKIISRRTFQGLWNLARLHLDHNHLEFIHPDAFQGLTSLRLLQLEGNRLQQLHPATFATFSVLSYFPMSTLKHLYLSENGLTTLSQKMLATMPQLENLFLHENPWTCDCRIKWFKEWSSSAPDVLKCKKDRAFPGGQLCPVCFSPRQLKKKDLRELDNPKCTSPVISAPHRTSTLDTESELMTLDDFSQPLGNVSLGLTDEHGNQVDLNCHVNEPTKSTRMNWNHVNSFQINTNVTVTLDLECPIDRGTYEKLWRLVAYYSDVPAHLKREIMLSKDPHISYRYRQDAEMDAVYFTGMKANMVAEPAWIMQSAVNLQLNRPQSTSKRVRLTLSTHLTQLVEAEEERQQRRQWVLIESRNSTKISQVVVVGNPIQMHCNVHSSGNPSIKWMLPNGSKVEAPYQSSDNRITVSPSGLLAITAVDHSDSGVYYCIAIVVGDVSILPFRLTVEDSSTPAPGSEGMAEPMAGVAGRPVSLPCVALGSPDPDINWILPDNTIINTWSNLSRMFVASNGTLTIRNSQLSDNGFYKCVAETQHGVDSLATKVTLTRPSGGHPIRKYSSRPQPAEGVSTKIKAPINNDVEASGDNENEGPEAKTFEQLDTSYKRRIPNAPVRGGHPTRKVWRRPPLPRRQIISKGAERSNRTEIRRRINVSNGQIDPEHWANILAKVRNSGDNAKTTTTTTSSVLTSTNRLQQVDTAITKQSESLKRMEGSIPDSSTTRATPQEASHTVTASETSVQTTALSLDIKPLDAEDQIHITYQIAAPEVNQDSDLIDAAYTTIGPQPTAHSVIDADIAKWDEVSTVESTTLFQHNQSHTLGSKETEAIPRARGDGNDNAGDNEDSILKSHGIEVYQGKSDHSPISTTSMVFEEQNPKNYYATRLSTDIAKTALQEKHDSSQIPVLTTMAPRSQSTLENDRGTHTTSINLKPPSHARVSSNSKRKNNGRRRKPNRKSTKPILSQSAYFMNITPKPTTLAIVSEVTKMTATSESKIATSTGVMSIGAKVNSTVPLTDIQATSLSETSNENRSDPLLDIRNTISPDTSVSEKVSEAEHTPLPYAIPHNISLGNTVLSVSSSTSLGFIGQSNIHRETVSTLPPLIQNTPSTDHETVISLHPLMGIHFEEAESESTTGHPSSGIKYDTSSESPQTQSEAIPGASLDKAENQYKSSENKFVTPSKELVKAFSLKPFPSSAVRTQHEIIASHDSEIPSGSTKANIYEGAPENSQVTTERFITSQNAQQSGMATTTKLNSASPNGKQETVSGRKAEIAEENTVPLMEDHNPVTTLKTTTAITANTPTTTPPPKTLSVTTLPPTTPKRCRPSVSHPHTSFQNIPSIWGRSGIPDSPNHIPDRHRERIVNPEQSIRSPNRNRPTEFHSTSLSEHIKTDSTDTELSTKKPKPQTTLKVPTTTPEVLVPPPRQTLPVKPNGSSSFIHHPTSTYSVDHSQQKPVIPARRGRPKIINTNISTVTVQAESDAYLPCVAVGEPRPFLSWTKISTGASITQNTKIQRFEVHPNGTLTIRNILPLDQGQYLCSVQNQYGQDKLVVTLIVLAEHPRVFQPRYQDITKTLGDTIDLECRSQGNPHPRTTWVLPNRAIVHMEAPSLGTHEHRISILANGTLRIKSATYTDRGVYKCIASNAAGADTISVRLTVAALPPVIQQLKNENITLPEGSTVYLNCSAKGAPPPAISWSMPNGVQLHSSEFVSGLNLFVFNNGTLYIRGLSPANAGKYECTATNTVGISSRAVSLTVKKSIASARARITSSSPQKTDVIYGGKLQLDCVAAGDPEPRVIWRTPSKKLVDAHYSYDPRIKVFANGSLSIHSVTEKDEGDYLCAAHNKMGDDYAPLKVSILTKPAKIEQKTQINQKVMYGGDLKVDCVASGLPNPQIQWALPDGTMVNSIMKSDRSSGGPSSRYVVFDNGTLFFNDVGMHEEGDYTCYAENQIGKDEMKVHVKVVADVPVIRNKTFEVIRVMYGDSASLKCTAKGEPNPHILWFSPTNRVIPSASDKYLIHNDGTLVIQKVQRFDGGNYTCLARNSAGQDRKVARLEILVSPPAINGLRGSTNSLKVSAMKNQRKLIHCEASGTPVPHVLWVFPENVILPAPYYGTRMTVHRNGTLDIHSLRVTDTAKLTCIARNEGGEARLMVQLDVMDIIEKPRLKSPKTESFTLTVGRTMMLNCSVEGSPAPQLTWVLPSGSPLMSGSQFNKFYHRSDGTLVITNPAVSEAGTYRCLGRNAGGLVERTVVLTPGRKPEINNRYNSPVSVINGESLQLHCLSTSDPVRLTWTLPSGVVLNRPQRAGRYAVLPNGTLSIQQASVYDRGSYTCRAANEYGSSLLTIPVAIIAYSPRISSGPPPTTYARRGVAVQLNCVATGIPKAEVAWETPDRTRLIVSTQPRLFGNKYIHPQGFLIIQNPTPRDTGFYRCTARNVIGVDSKGTYLHVY
ncbi:matrix-remodeling-associated protein 5 isoform X2 [Pangasianodon hypophthalmus]|uniref:matrix-remodeling-associated protein 5 isoform X2 n=1 Tax=Pangasianodon hypophthalmus TaxID=310915 RepID=UPI002307134E|nr:matrix-remodeling-associated protein 5 isoform X2 [Pangasianodon hypophthalmus]